MSIEEKVSVRVLVSMIGYATEQLAKFDDDFKSKLKGVNEVIQWKIGEDIAYYTEIKDQNIKSGDETASNPTMILEIIDVSDALSLFTRRADISSMVGKGKIKMSGDAAKFQQLGLIMDTLGEYMEGLGE